ncbi:hypothetical protein BC567DRAFT_223491 [Phyllosticta citribraziliensis]
MLSSIHVCVYIAPRCSNPKPKFDIQLLLPFPPRSNRSAFKMSSGTNKSTSVASGDTSRPCAGYNKYACAWRLEQTCPNWVFQNGDACAKCQASLPNIYVRHFSFLTAKQSEGLKSKRT